MHTPPPAQPPKVFPYSVVWTPIPVLSWILPFVGHIGLCTSDGTVFDFAGSYYVTAGSPLFGHPTSYVGRSISHCNLRSVSSVLLISLAFRGHAIKAVRYWQLDPDDAAALVTATQTTGVQKHADAWDSALQVTKHRYQQLPYNFITSNCHNFACHFLSHIQYASHDPWQPILLAAECFRFSRFVGITGVLKTWLPFCIVLPLGWYLVGTWVLWSWLALVGLVVAGFYLMTLTMQQNVSGMYRASSI